MHFCLPWEAKKNAKFHIAVFSLKVGHVFLFKTISLFYSIAEIESYEQKCKNSI